MSPRAAEALRRIPTQDRGERRVAALLNAAASVIAENGYEAATMSDIAERAGSSIGSLYQFFPNKVSVGQALWNLYTAQFEELWRPLERRAKTLTPKQLTETMIDSTISFVDSHPAFLALFDAPGSTRRALEHRERVRQQVAGFLRAGRPRMSKARALRQATVSLQIIRALNQLYAELHAPEKRLYVQEFKMAVVAYLNLRTSPQ